ncbi:hypothetical protein ABPG72_005591 [Tetrahymena utriculariae]
MLANIILNIIEDYKKDIPLSQSTQIPLLLQHYDYFEYQKDSRNILKQLCQKVEYHYQPKNSFLFHKDQFSDYLYILLEGEVLKLEEKDEYDIAKEIQLMNQERQILSQIKQFQNQSQDTSKLKIQHNQLKIQILQQINKNEAYDKLIRENCGLAYKNVYFNSHIDEEINLFKVTQKMTVGNMLGHISCIDQFEQKRPFSVYASEECRFICIKLSYIQQLYSQKILIRSYIFNYFKCLGINLASLADSKFFNQYFEELTFSKYDTVINQNEKNDHCFYIVLQGKFVYTYQISQDLIRDHSFIEEKKELLELDQNDLFGHEQKVNNNNSSNKNKPPNVRQFSVICTEDNSKVIKIQSILLQSRINQESFCQIIDLGKQLQQNLENQIGLIPVTLKNNIIQQKNQIQINNFVNKLSDQLQTKSRQSLNTEESENQSPSKTNISPKKIHDSPLRLNTKSNFLFRQSFSKIQMNSSQRQSPIILRDSPKIKIEQKIKLNLNKDQNTKIDSVSKNNFDKQETINESSANINYKKVRQISCFDFFINRNAKSCNNKKIKLDENTNSNNQSPINSQQDVQHGFLEAVNQYHKSRSPKKSINSQSYIHQKVQLPLNLPNKQNFSRPNANRSASMIQFPSLNQVGPIENKKDQKVDIQESQNNYLDKNNYTFLNRQSPFLLNEIKKKQDLQKQIQQLRFQFISVEGQRNLQILSPIKNKFSLKQINPIFNSENTLISSPSMKVQNKSQIFSKRPSIALDFNIFRQQYQRIQEIN